MSMDASSFYEKPTAESEASIGANPTPPPQLMAEFFKDATAAQVAAATKAGQAHVYLGGKLDGHGWPVDKHGHRIELGGNH